nr:ABC transporter permease [Companilactobacillus musae]
MDESVGGIMFLAIKEILHNKTRYLLVVFTVFLISYLVFFLTSLAVGLARENRTAVDQWQAKSAVISSYSNKSLTVSTIPKEKYQSYTDDKNIAELGQMTVVSQLKDSDKKINTNIFGVDWNSFISPKLIEGRLPKNNKEVVIDNSLENDSFKMNSRVKINGSSNYFKVVGITKNNSFFAVPVIFTNMDVFRTLKYGSDKVENISGLVVKNNQKIKKAGLTQISIKDLINHIPGYNAQVLVFSFMIVAMIIITFLIISIFMYIITIQKISLYGVMRAQGIRTGRIVESLFYQIFILTILGSVLALVLIAATQLFLPKTVPFYSNWLAYGVLTLAIVVMALMGGLISIRRVVKIDPLSAIEGE